MVERDGQDRGTSKRKGHGLGLIVLKAFIKEGKRNVEKSTDAFQRCAFLWGVIEKLNDAPLVLLCSFG